MFGPPRHDRSGLTGTDLKRLKLVTHLLARRLLFREFLLQAVYVIDARTVKWRGVVYIPFTRVNPLSRNQEVTDIDALIHMGLLKDDQRADAGCGFGPRLPGNGV